MVLPGASYWGAVGLAVHLHNPRDSTWRRAMWEKSNALRRLELAEDQISNL
jgi:uncharacterized protein with LGFP repeats